MTKEIAGVLTGKESLLSAIYLATSQVKTSKVHADHAQSIAISSLGESNYSEHTKYAVTCNNLAITYAMSGNYTIATNLIEISRRVFEITVRKDNYLFVMTCLNLSIIKSLNPEMKQESMKEVQLAKEALKSIDPGRNLYQLQNLVSDMQKLLEQDIAADKLHLCKSLLFHLLDHPFGWIDYPPTDKCIILGADSQVWEYIEKMQHMWPFQYQWIAFPWLGEFHKLGNYHLRLKKRYENFHLKEHARHFLNDATASKLEKFMRMDDFDLSNSFFYHDQVAGLTELILAVKRYHKERSTRDAQHQMPSINIKTLKEFCDNQGGNCPTMCVISKYLLEDNMYTLAYLESQKFGNLQLNEAAHKKAAPFNFTTRAVHYGPDYIGHIRNLELARPHEREASKYTWTENRRQEPGHRRPQDQALEARMNKAVKQF